jgi:hypothetical protein
MSVVRWFWLILLLMPWLAAAAFAAAPVFPVGSPLFGFVAESSDIIFLERPEDETISSSTVTPARRVCGADRLRPVFKEFVDYAIAAAMPRGGRAEYLECEDLASADADVLMIAADSRLISPQEADQLAARLRTGELRKRALVSYGAYVAASLLRWDGTSSSGKPVALPGQRVGLLLTPGGGDALCIQPGSMGALGAASAILSPALTKGMRQETAPMSSELLVRSSMSGKCGAMVGDIETLGTVAADLNQKMPEEVKRKLLNMFIGDGSMDVGKLGQAAEMLSQMLVGSALRMPPITIDLARIAPPAAPKEVVAPPPPPEVPQPFLGPILRIPVELMLLAVGSILYVGAFYVFGAASVIETFNRYAAYHRARPVVPPVLQYFWTAMTVTTVMASFLAGGLYVVSDGSDVAVTAAQVVYLVAFSAALFAALAERMVVGAIADLMDRELLEDTRHRMPLAIKLSTMVGGLAFFSTYLNLVVDTEGAALERA